MTSTIRPPWKNGPAISVVILISGFGCSAGGSGPRGPIIDMHLHAYSEADFSALPNPVTGQPCSVSTAEEHRQACIAAMKRYHIVKAVVSSIDGTPQTLQAWQASAPDRVIGALGGYNGKVIPDLGVLRQLHAAGELGVMGEIGAQYGGMAPADERLAPYFALAAELDIPVGIHTGAGPPLTAFRGFPHFRLALGNPLLLEPVLLRHPDLRIYLMHAGAPYQQETIALMAQFPNVYADLAVINWIVPRGVFHDYLRDLIRFGFGDRLMFGSDQMGWPEAIGMAIEGIDSADFLSAEQKRDIFYNNAARFLRIDE